jgi:hypothetical protein
VDGAAFTGELGAASVALGSVLEIRTTWSCSPS